MGERHIVIHDNSGRKRGGERKKRDSDPGRERSKPRKSEKRREKGEETGKGEKRKRRMFSSRTGQQLPSPFHTESPHMYIVSKVFFKGKFYAP